MDSGRFFALDPKSEPAHNEVVFRYLRVWAKNANQNYRQYPIYVTLQSNAIVFRYNGLIQSYDQHLDKDKNYVHQHHDILTLPLSEDLDVKDNLTQIERELISETVEIHDDYYYIHHNKNTEGEEEIDFNEITSYSSVEKNTTFLKREEIALFDVDLPKVGELLKRTLLLDFLFDLEHSKIFEHSHNFEQVEARLKQNNLINAIALKCEYYYVRKRYCDVNQQYGDTNIPKKWKWATRYLKIEKEWLDLLSQPITAQIQYGSDGWLHDIEREVRAVLFNDIFKKQNWISIIKIIYLILGIRYSENVFHRKKLFDFIKKICDDDKHNFRDKSHIKKSIKSTEYETTQKVNGFFINRFNILQAYRYFVTTNVFFFRGSLILWMIAVFVFIPVNKYFFSEFLFKSSSLAVRILLPLSISWLVFALILPAIVHLLSKLNQYASYPFRKKRLPSSNFSLNLILPRLQMAIITSWILFLATEELWKVSILVSNEKALNTLIILLIIIAFFYLYNIIANRVIGLNTRNRYIRTSLILLYGYIVSFSFGILPMSIIGKPMITNSGILEENYQLADLPERDLMTLDYTINEIKDIQHDVLDRLIVHIFANFDNDVTLISEMQTDLNRQKNILDRLLDTAKFDSKIPLQIEREIEANKVKINEIFEEINAPENNKNDKIFLQDGLKLERLLLERIQVYDKFSNALNDEIRDYNNPYHLFENNFREDGYVEDYYLVKRFNKNKEKKEPTFTLYPKILPFIALVTVLIGIFIHLITQNRSIAEPL